MFPKECSGNGGLILARMLIGQLSTNADGDGEGLDFKQAVAIKHFQMRAETVSTRVGFGTLALAALALRDEILEDTNTYLLGIPSNLSFLELLGFLEISSSVVMGGKRELFAVKSGANTEDPRRAVSAQALMNELNVAASAILWEMDIPSAIPPHLRNVAWTTKKGVLLVAQKWPSVLGSGC